MNSGLHLLRVPEIIRNRLCREPEKGGASVRAKKQRNIDRLKFVLGTVQPVTIRLRLFLSALIQPEIPKKEHPIRKGRIAEIAVVEPCIRLRIHHTDTVAPVRIRSEYFERNAIIRITAGRYFFVIQVIVLICNHTCFRQICVAGFVVMRTVRTGTNANKGVGIVIRVKQDIIALAVDLNRMK